MAKRGRGEHGQLESWGPVRRVGVEGTGSYGAGLARHLAAAVSAAVPLQRSRQINNTYYC